MWTYAQKSGELWREGQLVATGYSGCDEGKNNPAMQGVEDVGPIPQGDWTIEGPPINTAKHGPFVLTLTPSPGTDTLNRSGFLIHGDSIKAPGTASEGCIIMAQTVREQIWDSGDRDLEVVPEFAPQDLPDQNA
jgi:Protein of unknown function (DUF2778)